MSVMILHDFSWIKLHHMTKNYCEAKMVRFFSFNFKLFSSKVSQQNNNQSCNFGLNLFSLLKQCLGVVLVCTMLYIIILGLIIRSWDLRLDLKNWELVKHAAEQICSRSSHQSHWNLTQLSLLSLYWECLNMSQSVHTLSLSILKCCVCVSQLFDHKLIYGADFQGGLQNDELAYLMLRRGIFHDRNIFLWDSQLKLLSVLKMTYWCCCTLFIREKFLLWWLFGHIDHSIYNWMLTVKEGTSEKCNWRKGFF